MKAKASTQRLILRIVHLVAVVPVLGYVYQPVAEAAEYQRFTQFVFIPLVILTGYWIGPRLGHPRCRFVGRTELLSPRKLGLRRGPARSDRAVCCAEDLDDDEKAVSGDLREWVENA
jgi:hypothetical protein